jgi:Guanosine polyphosphate pyrophosphohydrolases/synthetases
MAAYRFSAAAHEGQMRKSGEPYISHPVTVACILAELHLDAQAVMASLLHDVMEDTSITKQQIGEQFGKTVAELVDGVSKLDKIEFQTATTRRRRTSAKCCWRCRRMCA